MTDLKIEKSAKVSEHNQILTDKVSSITLCSFSTMPWYAIALSPHTFYKSICRSFIKYLRAFLESHGLFTGFGASFQRFSPHKSKNCSPKKLRVPCHVTLPPLSLAWIQKTPLGARHKFCLLTLSRIARGKPYGGLSKQQGATTNTALRFDGKINILPFAKHPPKRHTTQGAISS